MSFFEKRAELLKKSNETDDLKYGKVSHSTGAGDLYEERSLALLLLRCLRQGLRFALSSNDGAAGKFGRIVLCWRTSEAHDVSALFVQLRHKTSSRQTTICRSNLMWRKEDDTKDNDFSIGVLRESYTKMRDSLDGGSYALVLSTNVDLDGDAQHMFVRADPESVHGVKLLESGGRLYRLNPDDEDAKVAVQGDERFMRDFYLFCNQSNSETIQDWIYGELKVVIGADESYCKKACEDLCSRVREWMNNENVCLTDNWKKWLDIVDAYVREEVTMCNSEVTRIKYSSVEALRAHIEECNPAWIRPPGCEATALSATKVHQAVCGERHIVVTATRFSEMQERIMPCWGPYCRWLVVVDDAERGYDTVLHMGRLVGPKRRLVIVSYKGSDSFLDICNSSDVCEDSWKELTGVSISLNSERHLCRLEELCGTEALKAMLDGKPEALVALSQLSGPVRMGQALDPLPQNHIPRQLICRTRIKEEFFSALGDKEICIIDEGSHKLLSNKAVVVKSVMFEELENYLSASGAVWPVFVITSIIDVFEVKMISSKYANIQVYVLSFEDDGWQILFFHGDSAKIRQYVEEQSKSVLQTVNGSRSKIVVEGKPGVGKSTLLLQMASQLKDQNPSWWVLTIDLFKYSDVLDGCETGVKASKDILVRAVYNENSLGMLEHSLLQHCLMEYPRIICMVDSFDDDSPYYTEKCLQALQELAPRRGKMVVTTQPSVTGRLEAALGVLAHSLPAFTEEELDRFHRWCHTETGVTDVVRDLLKIPLFSRMFAESLESGIQMGDIVTLYEDFFEKKFRRMYVEKWGDDLSIPGKKIKYHKERLQHERQLGFLAVSHLLPELQVSCLAQRPSIYRGGIVKSGIVYQFIDDQPVFIHRTFAEYFLAKWCFLYAADSVRASVYSKAISDSSLEFFVESFDRMARRGRPRSTVVLNGSESEAEPLLQAGAHPAEADTVGRS